MGSGIIIKKMNLAKFLFALLTDKFVANKINIMSLNMDLIDLVTIKERAFDRAFMTSIWESRCAEEPTCNGVLPAKAPSFIETLYADIEKWFENEGFPEVRLYYSFAMHLWATGRMGMGSFMRDSDESTNKICLRNAPAIFTNNGMRIVLNEPNIAPAGGTHPNGYTFPWLQCFYSCDKDQYFVLELKGMTAYRLVRDEASGRHICQHIGTLEHKLSSIPITYIIFVNNISNNYQLYQ
jgi:hypothetical protein